MSDDESTRPIDIDGLRRPVSEHDEAPTAAGLPVDEAPISVTRGDLEPASATRVDVAAPRDEAHEPDPSRVTKPEGVESFTAQLPRPQPAAAEEVDLGRTDEHPALSPESSSNVVELDPDELESVPRIEALARTGEPELPRFSLDSPEGGEDEEDAQQARLVRPTQVDSAEIVNESGEVELTDDGGDPSTASLDQAGPHVPISSGSIQPPASVRPPSYQPPALAPPARPAYSADPDEEERRLQDQGMWAALVEVYRGRLMVGGPPAARADLLHRLASVLELGDRDDEAFDAIVEAWSLCPADGEIAMSLDRIGKHVARLGEVAERAIKRAHGADPETRIALLGHIVYWYERCLGRPSEVGRFVSELERLDKTHPVTLRRQAQIAASKGDLKAQRELLSRALERTTRRDEKVALYLALASSHAGSPDAAKFYESAVAADPTSIVALQGLERIGREQEKHSLVEWALEQQIAVAPTSSERVDALLKLADLEETKFLRRERAAQLLERVLELEPASPTALKGLERCYHALREWYKLVRILHVRAENTYDKKAQVDLLQLAAEVHEGKMSDPAGAIECYRDLLHAEPMHRRALADLARLSEKVGDWAGVSGYRARLAELAPRKREASRLLVQLGELLSAPDRAPSLARSHFERAVGVDPTNATAWEALQRVAAAAGDERRVAQCMLERAKHTEAARPRAAVLAELGAYYAARGEAQRSRDAYERAVRADPANEAAAAAMLEIYAGEEKWLDAAPLCDLLVNAANRDKDTDALFRRLRLQTRIAAALGDAERAMTAALGALEARPDDPDAQADLLAVVSQVRVFPNVVARARPWLSRLTSAPLAPDAMRRLARIQRDLGDVDAAAQILERAIEAAPDDADAKRELADVYLTRGDFPRACEQIVALARNATSAEAKFKLLAEAGEIWAKRARQAEQAAAVYEEARRIKPNDSWLFHTLVGIYVDLGDWGRLSSVLQGVVQIQETPERKAKSLFAVAELVRDKLHDPRNAADLFDQVLDLDRKRLDAFEELVRALTEAKDWAHLERAYRKMIARIKDDDEPNLRFALFQQLGLIYRDRLGDAERAYEAFGAAGRIRPDDADVRQIVTELLVVTDNLDSAIERTRDLVQRSPHDPGLYSALYELFLRQRSFDKAWCALDVLAQLEGPTPEQRQFLEDYPPMPLDQVPGQIIESAWKSHMLHPDLDPTLTALFALMTPAVARMRHAQLRPEQRVGRPFTPKHSPHYEAIRKAFANAAEILALRAPELLLGDPGSTAPFAPALAPFGAVLVDASAVAAQADTLTYVVGKRLSEQRPELSARAFFPSVPDLTQLLAAAVRVSRQEAAKDPAAAALDAGLLATMSLEERNGIRVIVAQITMDGGLLDVKRWQRAADLSSMRAGLLVAGDVGLARKTIIGEPVTAGDLPTRDRIGELYKFAVSDLYADLRGAIGVTVQG